MNAKHFYEVRYRYYQYNSGAADNGTYTRSRRFDTSSEALELAARINAYASAHEDGSLYDSDDSEDSEDDLSYETHRDLIPYDGYFIWAKVFEVNVEEREIVQEHGEAVR